MLASAAGALKGHLSEGRHLVVAKRWAGSYGKARHRYDLIRQRATEQHPDYVRQLKPPRPQRRIEVDPKLRAAEQEVRQVLSHPDLCRQPREDVRLLTPDFYHPKLEDAANEELTMTEFPPFGRIEVTQGDIFTADVEAVIIPMTANLLPYRGLSLEAYERGGEALVRDVYDAGQVLLDEKLSGREDQGATTADQKIGLQEGDCLVVEGRGCKAKKTVFVIVPWFWQGSPVDAAKRLRYCVGRAMRYVSGQEPGHAGFSSVALPNLGAGLFGYEPRSNSSILAEEAVEALLQVEAQKPTYKLQRVVFMDNRRDTAETLAVALKQVSHRWLPEERLSTAAEYWSQAERRLLVLPATPNWFLRRRRYKFKRYHGVKRRWRRFYQSSMRPFMWRAQKVQQPPPLMVYKDSGEVAPKDFQRPARPFYFRGVSHWLFPSRKSGYHNLRKNSKGQWIASAKHFQWVSHVRPRL
eukprot:TRINITY_DN39787_c0_g1_i1.p1 TRINITY_DN39787_c0_g1~~TRINITY_DN39787_c0_g1_i1.p1  ORF type:complete len:467 (-),score=108.11 TRINITY_DN39787_c0_g1_i1:184-1584(-)